MRVRQLHPRPAHRGSSLDNSNDGVAMDVAVQQDLSFLEGFLGYLQPESFVLVVATGE